MAEFRVEQYIMHVDTDDVDVDKLYQAFKLIIEGSKWSLVSDIFSELDLNFEEHRHTIYIHALYIRCPNVTDVHINYGGRTVNENVRVENGTQYVTIPEESIHA
jgi:hypothetical protein